MSLEQITIRIDLRLGSGNILIGDGPERTLMVNQENGEEETYTKKRQEEWR